MAKETAKAAAKKPAAKPVAKKVAAKKPAAKKPAAKTASKPAAKKVAVKKPAEKKPAPKKKPENLIKRSDTKKSVTLKDAEVTDDKNLKTALSSAGSIRMFKNPLLEKLSHVHPVVPLVLYLPVIVVSIIAFFRGEEASLENFLVLFPLGILFWTITEYTLHRFLFHPPFEETHLRWLYFYTHGVHHEAPNDATRLVMPPGASIPLAILFYFIFRLVMPENHLAFYAGFVSGYLTYDFLHFSTHFFSFKWAWFKKLKKHHNVHHFNDPKKNYGVSNSFWDYVFFTKYRGSN
jgi:sterol desaturase/sphingolipid hydroxylase (fatty acid hydroxylase superfamily)